MNVLEQTQTGLKDALAQAIIKAELAQETDIPDIHLKNQKIKRTVILLQILRCSWRE